jgi:hypothetical protein
LYHSYVPQLVLLQRIDYFCFVFCITERKQIQTISEKIILWIPDSNFLTTMTTIPRTDRSFFYFISYRSAHGISAIPEKAKHAVSPNKPVASPNNAIGPIINNQFNLLFITSPDE